jgi:hypothetical protein
VTVVTLGSLTDQELPALARAAGFEVQQQHVAAAAGSAEEPCSCILPPDQVDVEGVDQAARFDALWE